MLTKADLSQFTGSEEFFRHWTNRIVYTQGCEYLAKEGGAFWLLDAIASYQHQCKRHKELQHMQFWKFKKLGAGGVLTCSDGNSDRAIIKQDFDYTTFPLDEVDIWVEQGSVDGVNTHMVAMLPSER